MKTDQNIIANFKSWRNVKIQIINLQNVQSIIILNNVTVTLSIKLQ